ncbi:hypothetical protein GCM10025331_45260 [Actinoplanes utahensis]
MRRAAPAAPLLLLAYSLFRLFDGADGVSGPGPAQPLGHLVFAGALLMFVALAAAVHAYVPRRGRHVAATGLAATISGAACFLWTVIDVLSPALRAPLPTPFAIAGPLLFSLGMSILLGLLVAARQAPVWSPLLFGAGIATALIDIDFLPFAALILLAALAPLARPDRNVTVEHALSIPSVAYRPSRPLLTVGASSYDS